jgi:hypothetical protein
MRILPRFAVTAALCIAAPSLLLAQGSLGLQGFGYPGGEQSTRALGSGGSLADFDANSPINPAALLVGTRATVYMQYDPEFRWISGPGVDASTITARFPIFMISGKVGQARFSLSYASFLDRTWTNTYQDTQTIGGLKVPSTVTAVSTGGIADIRAAASYSISPRLTVGVAAHVFPGQNHVLFGRAYPSDSASFGAFSQTNTFNFSGSAVSFGVIAIPVDHLNLGVSGRYGFSMHVHQGDSTTLGDAKIPNRMSYSIAYDGFPGSIISARYGTEAWSAMRGLGSSGLSVFDATEFSAGLETPGPHINSPIPIAIRLGYHIRQLPFGVGTEQVKETQMNGGVGIPLSGGRVALDLSLAHSLRTAANIGFSEKSWILSVGLSIKPY